MTRALVIGAAEDAAIKKAIETARDTPVPMGLLKQMAVTPKKPGHITLADRKPEHWRPPSTQVEIPFGYRAAISFEEHPGGLCRHLSVSVNTPGAMPNPYAFQMIAEAFGIKWPPESNASVWVEEIDPGHGAINIVVPDEECK